jgi:hypothetical protein
MAAFYRRLFLACDHGSGEAAVVAAVDKLARGLAVSAGALFDGIDGAQG